MSLHTDRARASSFGTDPERYDRARPDYPSELVDHLLGLVDGDPVRVLDVGCGTAISSRQSVAAGADVLGVEADERMAEIARRSGVEVEVAGFEQWDPGGRTFDLVVAGQAWHWLDPEVAPHRAADALRPGGVLAPFWNLGAHDEAAKVTIDRVYAERAPGGFGRNPTLGGAERWRPDTDHIAPIAATGRFGPADTIELGWDRVYSRDEWLDQLPSHSEHRLLPPDRLADLLQGIGEAIDTLGGSITMRYRTVAIVARRLV